MTVEENMNASDPGTCIIFEMIPDVTHLIWVPGDKTAWHDCYIGQNDHEFRCAGEVADFSNTLPEPLEPEEFRLKILGGARLIMCGIVF